MRIISKFTDYYDYVAKMYGGGDPKIVYERGRIGTTKNLGSSIIIHDKEVQVDTNFKYESIWRRGLISSNYDFKLLIVAGRAYPLVAKRVDATGELIATALKYELFDIAKHEEALHKGWLEPEQYVLRFMQYSYELNTIEKDKIIGLSREVGHPVFIINGIRDYERTIFIIDGNCPILKDYGFPSIMSPELLYQELAYFVGNLLRKSPDIEPPVQVSNNDRIVQHGFDLKQSFRHRK